VNINSAAEIEKESKVLLKAHHDALELAEEYTAVVPRPGPTESLWFHKRLKYILSKDTPLPTLRDLHIRDNLSYRFREMEQFTKYAAQVCVNLEPCSELDIDEWFPSLWARGHNEIATHKLMLYPELLGLVDKADIGSPPTGMISSYSKSDVYLAGALVESGETKREIKEVSDDFRNEKLQNVTQ